MHYSLAMNTNTFSTYKKSLREVLLLALPIIGGQLGQVLMGFFDTLQVSGLGATYIAASGFANTVYWVTNLLGLGILFGIAPLVSEAFGEKNEWKAIGVYRSGIKISLVISVVFFALMLLVMANIKVFRQTENINNLSLKYLRIINYSTPFALLFTAGKQLLDGMGRTTVGMLITMGGLLLNIFLNWLLVAGHWGMPALGIEGTAWATTVSRLLMAACIFAFIRFDKEIYSLRLAFAEHSKQQKSYVLQILKIGVPSGLQFFMEVSAFSAGQIMSGWLGENYLASHQIAINLASVTFMLLTGIAAAGTIMTGFAYGARNREGIRIAGHTVFAVTLFIEFLCAIFFLLLHGVLPHLYTDNAEVISIASSLLILAAFFQVSDGMQAAAAGVLRGIQDVRVPMVIAIVSYWGGMVPLSYFLAFSAGYGIQGLWIGFIVGLSIAAVLLLFRFRYKVRNIEFEEL